MRDCWCLFQDKQKRVLRLVTHCALPRRKGPPEKLVSEDLGLSASLKFMTLYYSTCCDAAIWVLLKCILDLMLSRNAFAGQDTDTS